MKYTTIVKGNITGVVQGDNATVVITNGKVVSATAPRTVKCRGCKQRVARAPHCSECGRPL